MNQNYLGQPDYGFGNMMNMYPNPNQPTSGNIPGIAPMQNYQNQPMTQQNSTPVLNGRLVENCNVLKNIDIPIGGYGVFPRIDFEEIYIKTWNKEGKPDILVFRFDREASQNLNRPNQNVASEVNKLYTKVDELTQKLNALLQGSTAGSGQAQSNTPSPTSQSMNDIPSF